MRAGSSAVGQKVRYVGRKHLPSLFAPSFPPPPLHQFPPPRTAKWNPIFLPGRFRCWSRPPRDRPSPPRAAPRTRKEKRQTLKQIRKIYLFVFSLCVNSIAGNREKRQCKNQGRRVFDIDISLTPRRGKNFLPNFNAKESFEKVAISRDCIAVERDSSVDDDEAEERREIDGRLLLLFPPILPPPPRRSRRRSRFHPIRLRPHFRTRKGGEERTERSPEIFVPPCLLLEYYSHNIPEISCRKGRVVLLDIQETNNFWANPSFSPISPEFVGPESALRNRIPPEREN